jgi:hypothetical protein
VQKELQKIEEEVLQTTVQELQSLRTVSEPVPTKNRHFLAQAGSWRGLHLHRPVREPATILSSPHPLAQVVQEDRNSGLHVTPYTSGVVPHQRLGRLCRPDSGWDRSLIQDLLPVPALGLGASGSYWILPIAAVHHRASPEVCCQS